MPQLEEPDPVTNLEYLSLLWSEVVYEPGRLWVFKWREPTEVENAARRQQRLTLLRDSQVPWIVSDIGAVMGFYDDVQDIVAFTTWNKRLALSKYGIAMAEASLLEGSVDELAAAYGIVCTAGRPSKRLFGNTRGLWWKRVPKSRGLAGWLGALAEGTIWGVLAGQVSLTLTGIGVTLGETVGAIVETAIRLTDPGGERFQRGSNKYYQLKRARALHNAQRGFGAMPFLPWDDRVTGFVGTFFAWRDTPTLPEYVIDPRDYPSLGQVLSDPFGVLKNLGRLVGTLPSNGLRYLMHDFLGNMDNEVGRFLRSGLGAVEKEYDPVMKAALRLIHAKTCPDRSACRKQLARFLKLKALMDDPRISPSLEPGLEREILRLMYGDFRRAGQ